jgi:hypothetical protein
MSLFEADKIEAGMPRPTIKAAGYILFLSVTSTTSFDIRRISDISCAANIVLTYLRVQAFHRRVHGLHRQC